MTLQKRVIIVGGGLTGLAAAHRLRTHSEIHLIEASNRLGGILHTTHRDGFILEGGPDCFLSEKLPAMELCRELGLLDQLISTRSEHRRSFIVRDGHLIPIPEGFYLLAPSRLKPFLSSPLLSWRGKWRVLADALIPSHPQPEESLASFVRRRLGKEALDWLAQPILAGIYAADPETLSLRATFPQFVEMEEKHGSVLVGLKKRDTATKQASGARYSLFASLKDGMQALTDRLEKSLEGVQIRRGTSLKKLEKTKDGWRLSLSNGSSLEADAVILALPAYRCAEFVRNTHAELAETLEAIPYSGSVTINLAYKDSDIPHPLEGFGFVTPHAENRMTLACTFVHRKFTGRAPSGHALLRAFLGGTLQEKLLNLDDTELEGLARADLKDLLGITRAPLFAVTQRWPRSMPQYTLGHIQRVLKIEESLLGLPGLAMAGNWLRGVGIPDSIESGQRAADALLQRLQSA